MHDATKPILIMTWGNPSRGDDALGPLMHDRLEEETLAGIEVLTDFQLQIEHTMDMQQRDRIIFVDASIKAAAPFEFHRLIPAVDDSYTTHAMSPESLLATYRKVNHEPPPPAFMLSIRGYAFDLGLPLSDRARANLTAAIAFVKELVSQYPTGSWDNLVSGESP